MKLDTGEVAKVRGGGARAVALVGWFALVACGSRAEAPDSRADVPESQLGRCAAGIDRELACGAWSDAVEGCVGDATMHTTFPQLHPEGCFVPVRYTTPDAIPTFPHPPAGCGFPRDGSPAALAKAASRYEAIAAGDRQNLPVELACSLSDPRRAAAARHNAATLRALQRRLEAQRLRGSAPRFPYATISTFGFGHPVMDGSQLVDWLPGAACRSLGKEEMDRFGVNRLRAGRAAAAYHGRVAPLVTVSGGAVHADLVEAFMLLHLLSCNFDVPGTAVLLDPCADHTHTNVRNTGSLLIGLGARTGYVITDSGLQGDYLQDWTGFELIGGSIDQRALRDWGYLVGSWHQASNAPVAGYWFTPYRFWGDERLATFHCLR